MCQQKGVVEKEESFPLEYKILEQIIGGMKTPYPYDREDLFQEGALIIEELKKKYDGRIAYKTYAFCKLKYKIIDALRSMLHLRCLNIPKFTILDDVYGIQDRVAHDAIVREYLQLVIDAVTKIKNPLHQKIVKTFLGNLSIQQTATKYKMPAATVQYIVDKFRAKVRKYYI